MWISVTSEKVSSIHKMNSCGLILAIILILVFLFFLWLIFRLDCEDNLVSYDGCGNPIPIHEVVVTPVVNEPPLSKLIKACLDKFSQAEHEIDTLCRSYIIECLCSCQDAENTYDRIQHLCDKLGECLALCYGRDVGYKYAQLKKACCGQLKSCVTQNSSYMDTWVQYEEEIAHLLATCNPCLSKDFLQNIRKDHCYLVAKMYQAHYDKNNLEAMVVYDSLKEKTDSYVENIVSATINCKKH